MDKLQQDRGKDYIHIKTYTNTYIAGLVWHASNMKER